MGTEQSVSLILGATLHHLGQSWAHLKSLDFSGKSVKKLSVGPITRLALNCSHSNQNLTLEEDATFSSDASALRQGMFVKTMY